MSISSSYRSLFSVNMLIDYYLTEEFSLFHNGPNPPTVEEQGIIDALIESQQNKYDLSQDFDIRPTVESTKLLKNYRLHFKKTKQGFFVGSQVSQLGDGSFVPFINMNESFSLRFAVYLKNPEFYNFSNIRMERSIADKDQFLYYFSNRANNQPTNGPLYLSLEVPDFDSQRSYEASELILQPGPPAVMQEAIEDVTMGAFNPANWRQIFTGLTPPIQFVTREDRIVLRPQRFTMNVASIGQESLVFQILDRNGVLIKTIAHTSSEVGTPLSSCLIDVSDLPSNYYSIHVENATGTPFPDLGFSFFSDDNLFRSRPFALIECFYEPNTSLGEYGWFDLSNPDNERRLRSPEYTIRWKNRSTYWRYYYENAPTFTSSDVDNLDPVQTNPNHRILMTNEPMALSQVGRSVEITINGDIILLPNPGVALVYPENGRVFSEINMGGGFGPPA